MKNSEGDFCPNFHRAVELIGRRWTGVVIRTMLRGATRFSEIAEAVPCLSDKMLTERLKELEAEGIVTRTVLPETPVRVEYRLTAKGRALESVLRELGAWACKWAPVEDTGTDGRKPEPKAARTRPGTSERRRM